MNSEQDEQLKEIEQLLQALGYNVAKEEKKYFVDVVVEVMDCIGRGMPKEEVYNLVHNKNGYIYVELAYFCYEQGMPKLHNSLEAFHQSRKKRLINKGMFKKVFDKEKHPDVFDSAYYVANYLCESRENSKQKVKNKSTVLM